MIIVSLTNDIYVNRKGRTHEKPAKEVHTSGDERHRTSLLKMIHLKLKLDNILPHQGHHIKCRVMHAPIKQAAFQLSSKLKMYKKEHPVVMGILQSGVEMGIYIARQLKADFTPLIVQQLIYPLGRKFVFGAVAEDGSVYLHPKGAQKISQEMIDMQEDLSIEIIGYRKKTWRRLYPLPNLEERTVILTDDHIATGASMVAAVTMCRNQGAYRIIVAIPAAPHSKIALLRQHADVVITLPHDAIASAVKDAFHSQITTDEEALALLKPGKASPAGLARSRAGATASLQPGKRTAGTQNTGRKSKLVR